MPNRQWSDNDRYIGPFTYSREPRDRTMEIMLGSGDEERSGCYLRVRAFGHIMIVALPSVLRPYSKRVEAKTGTTWRLSDYWNPAERERMGRDWYDVEIEREFGVAVHDGGYVSVAYGRQGHDSRHERRWGYFLPWTQWRYARYSLYEPSGAHFATFSEATRKKGIDCTMSEIAARDACPSLTFDFADYDGERIRAMCRIEEREWHFGTGWWYWLSYFRQPKIIRSLDIRFSSEVGERKGSWKGGTIGDSIDIVEGETVEQAFRRYCVNEGLTYVSSADEFVYALDLAEAARKNLLNDGVH